MNLPEWSEIEKKFTKSEPLTAIEMFIFENEPAGFEAVKTFREGLSKILEEAEKDSSRLQWLIDGVQSFEDGGDVVHLTRKGGNVSISFPVEMKNLRTAIDVLRGAESHAVQLMDQIEGGDK